MNSLKFFFPMKHMPVLCGHQCTNAFIHAFTHAFSQQFFIHSFLLEIAHVVTYSTFFSMHSCIQTLIHACMHSSTFHSVVYFTLTRKVSHFDILQLILSCIQHHYPIERGFFQFTEFIENLINALIPPFCQLFYPSLFAWQYL